jgi:3-oxoadipate enol-lactonase
MASSSGLVTVSEGKIFWKLTAPTNASPGKALLFIHAGITDHTLWNAQVAKFVPQGWSCLVADNLGFGSSLPSAEFLAQDPRPLVDINKHLAGAIAAALPKDNQQVVVIGISMGGHAAVEFAIQRPDLVKGLVVIAGGVRGFDCPFPDAEMQLFEQLDRLTEAKDIEGMAQWHARFWGHGPHRLRSWADGEYKHQNEELRDKILVWNRDLCAREVKNEGGMIFKTVAPEPTTIEQLGTIKIPTAVALGRYDETNTNNGMRLIARKIPGATLTEFPAAHLVNAEVPEDFDRWLEAFLKNRIVAK